MDKNDFPYGWDQERVNRVLSHYEEQDEEEAAAEDEAAWEDRTETFIEVPVELLPKVREILAKHAS